MGALLALRAPSLIHEDVPGCIPGHAGEAAIPGAGRMAGSQVCQREYEHGDGPHAAGIQECSGHLLCVSRSGWCGNSLPQHGGSCKRECPRYCRVEEAQKRAWSRMMCRDCTTLNTINDSSTIKHSGCTDLEVHSMAPFYTQKRLATSSHRNVGFGKDLLNNELLRNP